MFGSALLLVLGEALTQCVMSVDLPQDFIRTKETGISVSCLFYAFDNLLLIISHVVGNNIPVFFINGKSSLLGGHSIFTDDGNSKYPIIVSQGPLADSCPRMESSFRMSSMR